MTDSPFLKAVPAPAPAALPKLAVGVDEAAQLIGISTRSLWSAIARDEIRPAKIGRRRLILVSDLQSWLEAKRA